MTAQKGQIQKKNQQEILKFNAFCQKIWQRASGPGEHAAADTTYI